MLFLVLKIVGPHTWKPAGKDLEIGYYFSEQLQVEVTVNYSIDKPKTPGGH
jgi:hypothetical protein